MCYNLPPIQVILLHFFILCFRYIRIRIIFLLTYLPSHKIFSFARSDMFSTQPFLIVAIFFF